jgi:hypothetical protein
MPAAQAESPFRRKLECSETRIPKADESSEHTEISSPGFLCPLLHFPSSESPSIPMPYLTGYELIHAKEAQLRAIGLSRYGNTGWLKRARATLFSDEQIELFRSFSPPHPELFDEKSVKSTKTAKQKQFSPETDTHFITLGAWANRLYFASTRNLAPIPTP